MATAGVLVAGCASLPPSQAGYTAGAIAGSAIAPGIGAPLGGLVGLLAGFVVEKQMDKINERHERKTLADQLGHGPSTVGAGWSGQLTRVWVDETVRDGRQIDGHFDARALSAS
ncbi:MAG: hypothetical protein HY737_01635 [Candidatus Omnitrophica bacterium]|nr:hypothetical protein [Candidatus Omnitrophota bacterium]